jgi:uncharacterized protein
MTINIDELVLNSSKDICESQAVIIPSYYNFYNSNAIINVKGTIVKKGNVYFCNGTLDTTLNMTCDNCLKEVDFDIKLNITEKFSEVDLNEEDETFVITNNEIELLPAILSNIYLNIPTKVACDKDCKGLCATCGVNLNTTKCNCKTTITDPRFDILKEVFKNKEV